MAKAKGLKLKAKVVWLKLKWESLRLREPPILKQLGALRGREGIGLGLRGPPRRTPGLGALRDPRTSRAGSHWCGTWAPGAEEPWAPLGSLRELWGPQEFPQGLQGSEGPQGSHEGLRAPRGFRTSKAPAPSKGPQGRSLVRGPPSWEPGPQDRETPGAQPP